jgi:hypothetical protein
MPNWCQNDITISHPDHKQIEALVKACNENMLLDFAVPMPPEYAENEQWWDWRIENWGTKWEVSPESPAEVIDGAASFSFNSAWSPPIEAMKALAARGFEFEMFYIEEGMGFAGLCHTANGEFLDESGPVDEGLPEAVEEYWADAIADYRDFINEQE